MTITVLLFASYADAFGAPELRLDLPDGASVRDVLAGVRGLCPGRPLPPALVAVNQEYASPDRRLSATDEVAIIPPVAGG